MADTINDKINNVCRNSLFNYMSYSYWGVFFNYYRPLSIEKSGTNKDEKRTGKEKIPDSQRTMVEIACKVNNLLDILRNGTNLMRKYEGI